MKKARLTIFQFFACLLVLCTQNLSHAWHDETRLTGTNSKSRLKRSILGKRFA